MEKSILQVKNLCTGLVSAGKNIPIVRDVSIEVPQGKIVGIVGESGCGKTMTARSIMGLLKSPARITGGSILLDGVDLVKLREKEMCALRGREISMIFQEPMTSLNPVMQVGRQVQEVLLLHGCNSSRQARGQVLEMFRKVGIPDPEKRYSCYPHELSGGLRQRVMIAMAMVCSPRFLIADEPTTALDVTVQAQILDLMGRLRDETGTGIMFISHNLGIVADLCDYVYVMYGGRVVEQGDTQTLFSHPLHPYTRGLMGAVRSLREKQPVLETIPGTVPSLTNMPAGCSFCPRCPVAQDRCQTQEPRLRIAKNNHLVCCHMTGGEV